LKAEMEHTSPADFIPVLESFAREREDIRMLLVFGSRSRGDSTEKSDLDIGILYSEVPDLLVQGADSSEIEYRTGFETDVIILNNLYNDWPEFAYTIVCEATLVYAEKPVIWNEYRIRSYTSWFDFQYVVEQSRKKLLERIDNGMYGRPILATKN